MEELIPAASRVQGKSFLAFNTSMSSPRMAHGSEFRPWGSGAGLMFYILCRVQGSLDEKCRGPQ